MKLRLDELSWREIDGDLVVMDLRTSTYLTTNGSGTLLVKQLTEERTTAELVQTLVDAYGIPESSAERDVRTFVGELARSGLLQPAADAAMASAADQVNATGGKGVNTCTQSPKRS